MISRRFCWRLYNPILNFQNENNFSTTARVSHRPSDTRKDTRNARQQEEALQFSEMLKKRLSQASRSVCIQFQNIQEVHGMCLSCVKFGHVNGVYVNSAPNRTYALVEFANKSSLHAFLSNATFFTRTDQVPVQSKFLFRVLRPSRNPQSLLRVPVVIENSDLESNDELKACRTISEQISKLCETSSLSEVGIRTRFFLADALQTSIRQALPFLSFTPFGSTVNSLGTRNSDLDVNIEIGSAMGLSDFNSFSNGPLDSDYRFLTVTFDSDSKDSERQLVSRLIDFVGTYTRLTVPKCSELHVIRKARVPLVHIRHSLTGISIDLSARNDSAIDMGELLYNLSYIDSRFTALTLTLKRFAKAQHLIVDHPAPQLTGFMLAAMLIHFLQTRPVPLLCPLRLLVRPADATVPTSVRVYPSRRDTKAQPEAEASSSDTQTRSTNDGTGTNVKLPESTSESRFIPRNQRAHLRNAKAALQTNPNTETLESLLIEFLRYYAKFDYDKYAADLFEGTLIENAFGKPFTLLNPIDHNHIITQALTPVHIEQIRSVFAQAADELEKHPQPSDASDAFGLLRIFNPLQPASATTVPVGVAPSAEPSTSSTVVTKSIPRTEQLSKNVPK